MIEPLPGWSVEHRESGVILTPPAPHGERAGAIRYVERVRPIRRARDIARALPTPPGYRLGAISAAERLTTVEGEHAALVTVHGELDGVPLERTIGVVLGDDFYALLVGHARRPEARELIRAAVRQLAITDTHMLGARRRRFEYTPPAGWIGIPAGLYHAQWVPPQHPRDPSALTVFPALPIPAGDRDHVRGLLEQHVLRSAAVNQVTAGEPMPVIAQRGLAGRRWEVTTRGADTLVHDFVVLEDARYAYPLSLASPPGRQLVHLHRLHGVLASIAPVPAPPAGAVAPLPLAHWAE